MIEDGLESAFKAAGRDTDGRVQELWDKSLARKILRAVEYVKRSAVKNAVGDLGWFVDDLAEVKALQGLVQWYGEDRYEQREVAWMLVPKPTRSYLASWCSEADRCACDAGLLWCSRTPRRFLLVSFEL